LILLRQFDKKEWKDFGLWLHSPIHNSSEKVVKLYEYLRNRWQNTDSMLNEHFLLKSIGAQDFLVWKNIQQDEVLTKRRLMDTFLEKTTYTLIPPILNKTKNKLEAASLRNIKYSEDVFLLTEMEFYLTILLGNRSTDTELQRVLETLRQSFLSKSLSYYCAAINYKKILKIELEYPFLKHIKTYLENSSDKEIPIIRAYYSLSKLLEHEQPEDYFDLKNYLFEYLNNFGMTDIRHFFNFMTNHCNWKLKCWSAGTYFSEHQFVHIVKTALALHEIDWVQVFFKEHKNLLNPKVQDVFVNYYQALLAFELKEYDKAQGYLGQINTADDFLYHVQFKILYIKIFYDKKNLNIDNADTHPISKPSKTTSQNSTL